MAKNEKRIKVKNMPVEDYASTVAALEAHFPAPDITSNFALSTSDPDMDITNFYRELADLCEEHGVDRTVTIIGKFDSDIPSEQMVLFVPPKATRAQMSFIDDERADANDIPAVAS